MRNTKNDLLERFYYFKYYNTEKIKVMLKWEKHPRGEWIGFFKKLFQHDKFKHKIIKKIKR